MKILGIMIMLFMFLLCICTFIVANEADKWMEEHIDEIDNKNNTSNDK